MHVDRPLVGSGGLGDAVDPGTGEAVRGELLARGDQVAATARRPETLDDLAARYGEQLWRARLDVTDTTALREVVDRAFADGTSRSPASADRSPSPP
ncbi:hypothetical protein [Streptomyces sp. NPDC059894]|uniref:hypothetical protein n=1 Tax=unclassified Streptomyces TaxID=2593676 RepID=UPI0036463AF8